MVGTIIRYDGEWYKAVKKVKDDNPKPDNLSELEQELADLIIEDNA